MKTSLTICLRSYIEIPNQIRQKLYSKNKIMYLLGYRNKIEDLFISFNFISFGKKSESEKEEER
jgi:hypothetical protein